MPRSAGRHRIYAKHTRHPDEENLVKQKKQESHPSSSAVAEIAPVTQMTVQRAKTAPQSLSPQEVQQLQATVGNRALSQMMAPQPTRTSHAVAIRPVLQRSPLTMKQTAAPMTVVQRWKWPWRRNETDQQKLERYDRTIGILKIAIDILRVGHGVVMLPLTVIDLLSNIARPFTGNKAKPQSSGSTLEQNRKAFHNVLNGESQLVALMGGRNGYFDLKILKYMPWNIIPWIIGVLSRWFTKVNRKRTALGQRINNINDNQVGNGIN